MRCAIRVVESSATPAGGLYGESTTDEGQGEWDQCLRRRARGDRGGGDGSAWLAPEGDREGPRRRRPGDGGRYDRVQDGGDEDPYPLRDGDSDGSGVRPGCDQAARPRLRRAALLREDRLRRECEGAYARPARGV